MTPEVDVRSASVDSATLEANLGRIDATLTKSFLGRLEHEYSVVPFPEESRLEPLNNLRFIKIERWVYDRESSTRDGFKQY